MVNDYLEHYGIKGQKWGVRRYQNPDGTRTPEGKIRYERNTSKKDVRQQAIDKMNYRYHNRGPLSSLSDDELKSRINRLKLEEEYSRYMEKTQPVSRGKQFVKSLSQRTLEQTLPQLIGNNASAILINTINDMFISKRMEEASHMSTDKINEINRRYEAVSTYREHISPIKSKKKK